MRTHGQSRNGQNTGAYKSWASMFGRCYNPKNKRFSSYGGRGITICDEWRNSFEAFFRDMGPRPLGTSIDRINNDLGYFSGNCRWATVIEQQANKRNNRLVTIGKETKTVSEWTRIHQLNPKTVRSRVGYGWPDDKLFIHEIDERPRAVLTETQVQEIRAAYIPHKVSQRILAIKYGVLPACIQKIVERKTWKHVP